MKAVCVQAENGRGCFEDKSVYGEYEQVSWNASITVAFNVTVVSPLDPMLVAIEYDEFNFVASPVGLDLIFGGLGVFCFGLICIVVFQRRLSTLWIYGSLAVAAHGLSLGAGALLEDHWSWQAVYEWSGFAGLMLMVFGAPLALVCSVVFWNGLLAQGLSRAANAVVCIFAFLFCCGISLFSVCVLIRPWALPGVADASQDPLSALVGVFLLAVYGLHGLAFLFALVVAALNFERPAVREISLNALSTEDDELLLPRRQLRKSFRLPFHWATVVIAAFLLWLPLSVFATTALPPLWNVPVASYFPSTSENAWNLLLPSSVVLKLYLDVVV